MIAAVLRAWLVVLALSPAPPPRVLVLDEAGQPDQRGFVEALRIQLAGRGEVVSGAPLAGDTLPARVASAGQAAHAAGALLAVWLERAPAAGGGEDVVLYVVGEADGRAVVQVFRIPAGSPADTDRTLALKVGSVVDEMLTPAAQVVLAKTPPPSNKKIEPPGLPVVRSPSAQLVLGVDAHVGSSPGDRGWEAAGGVRAGVRLGELELHASVLAGTGDSWDRDAGHVRTRELTPALGARYGGLGGALALGVRADLGLRFVLADGDSPAGNSGSDTVLRGVLAAQVERRWRSGPVDLLVGLGAEWVQGSYTLEVNDAPVAQLGHLRGFVSVSLSWAAP